ncbi:MAG: hypothetical protein J7L61_01070 [Thermoplasmata archaeon]|nr:hypothetical protein [Thermoplasmata archaeon]
MKIGERITRAVHARGTETPFLIFSTFLVTFVATRLYVKIFHVAEDATLQTWALGYHWHHYWWGILFLSLGGWLGINHDGKEAARTGAILYGVGLGLLIDEAGLLLTDEYFTRATYSFFVGVSLLLLSVVFFPGFWHVLKRELRERRERLLAAKDAALENVEEIGEAIGDAVEAVKRGIEEVGDILDPDAGKGDGE